jgi:hypothetical protein
VLSGHFPDGRPLDRPHAAFLALPGPETPDGNASIAAIAIVLPLDPWRCSTCMVLDHNATMLARTVWVRRRILRLPSTRPELSRTRAAPPCGAPEKKAALGQ